METRRWEGLGKEMGGDGGEVRSSGLQFQVEQ